MLTDYIGPGTKLDLQPMVKADEPIIGGKRKTHESRIYDILSDDRIEIMMPTEKGKLVLLQVDDEYDLYFYTPKGLYQCFARIIDRYRSNNIYILVMDLISNLRKYQRREYYRFSCALDMWQRLLKEDEIDSISRNGILVPDPALPLKHSVIVDISGGGLRFVGNYHYEEDSLICCIYHLITHDSDKEYRLIGKVIKVQELPNKPGQFEHRVQYVNINEEEREEIIHFIFEEERRNRKR